VAQLPDAGEKNEMRVAIEWKVSKVRESFNAPIRCDGAGAGVAAQHLCDFNIKKVRRVQGFAGCEHP